MPPTPRVVKDLARLQDATPKIMNTKTEKKTRSILPLVEGTHEQIHVSREDGDSFLVAAQFAIDVLHLASTAAVFTQQFRDLKEKLFAWVNDRLDRIASAYLSVGTDGITLLVVQKNIEFDFDLETEMVDLDLRIVNDDLFSCAPFNTLLLPKVDRESAQTFLSAERVMEHGCNAE